MLTAFLTNFSGIITEWLNVNKNFRPLGNYRQKPLQKHISEMAIEVSLASRNSDSFWNFYSNYMFYHAKGTKLKNNNINFLNPVTVTLEAFINDVAF